MSCTGHSSRFSRVNGWVVDQENAAVLTMADEYLEQDLQSLWRMMLLEP